jgi:ferric-dicitrate binding protein FerR (iron transport regulator)
MNISREQYHRFLTNQCSEEERLLFTGYLEQHPEMLEQWLQAEDWEAYNDNMHLHPAFSARMRDKFLTYINGQQQQRTRWYRSGIAAAVAVAVITLPVLWLLLRPSAHKPIAVKERVADTASVVWQETRNTTDSAMKVLLSDRTVVKLYAHSTIRYQKTMTGNKRDVYLQGVAHFGVAKDAGRPFTVYAGGIATTALGTAFRVTAKPGKQDVQVKLYEGKVVVRSADAATAVKPVYLLPGDEVVMNAAGKYDLRVARRTKEPLTTSVKKNNPAGGDVLSFTNTPLTDVLDRLKRKFDADIRYDATAIKTIYITASFTEQDTLSGILNILCTLNNLQLQGTGTVFTISR